VASPAVAVRESATELPPGPRGEAAEEAASLEEVGNVFRSDSLAELDRRVVALCRERGPLRAVLARIAARLVWSCAWERIGYARLSDYATERLGRSARSVQDLARVGARLGDPSRLQDALVSGTLGWTKVRLLARLPPDEDEAAWIAHAQGITAEKLSRQVRAVERGSVEAGAVADPEAKSRLFEVPCSPKVRSKWHAARSAASKVVGHVLAISEAAEVVAAEVLSALPVDGHGAEEPGGEAGVSWSQEAETAGPTTGPELGETESPPPFRGKVGEPELPRPSFPHAMEAFLDGLKDADAFTLDQRFRDALAMERRLEARIGPLLAQVWRHWAHRVLGYKTRDAYARERLGMDPTRARALVRLERAAVHSEPFARAHRAGTLSWVKARLLLPMVASDPLGRFVEGWIARAGQVTVRRLREDVGRALALSETDRVAFRESGGLPPESGGESAVSPAEKKAGAPEAQSRQDREIGASPTPPVPPVLQPSTPEEPCFARFIGPADVVQLFRAVLCTVRRGMERVDGCLPSAGEALGVMLDHAFACWSAVDKKVAARHKVFARDGWRCAAPGCTSMQNLHAHHIQFRSAGGDDALENQITLCAFHHLRGVHKGLLRCVGPAPDGLRWELGIRPGVTPLLAYRSGDVQVPSQERDPAAFAPTA